MNCNLAHNHSHGQCFYLRAYVCVGMTVADWANHWKKKPQTLVLKKVNSAAFHDAYIDYVKDFAGACDKLCVSNCAMMCFSTMTL